MSTVKDPSSLFAPALHEGRLKRRTLDDITGRVPLLELHRQIKDGEGWPYGIAKDEFLKRDRGLCGGIVLTGGRINEVLQLERKQIIPDPSDENFWLITNFPVSKRKGFTYCPTCRNIKHFKVYGEHGESLGLRCWKCYALFDPKTADRSPGRKDYRAEIALPLEGAKYPWGEFGLFTKLLLEYLEEAPEEGKIFRIGRLRAWQVVQALTGVWPHYLRSVCESHLMRIMRDAVIVGRYMKVNPATLSRYVQADWRDFK